MACSIGAMNENLMLPFSDLYRRESSPYNSTKNRKLSLKRLLARLSLAKEIDEQVDHLLMTLKTHLQQL